VPPGQRLHGGPVPAGTGRAVDGRPGRLRVAVPPTAGDAAAQEEHGREQPARSRSDGRWSTEESCN